MEKKDIVVGKTAWVSRCVQTVSKQMARCEALQEDRAWQKHRGFSPKGGTALFFEAENHVEISFRFEHCATRLTFDLSFTIDSTTLAYGHDCLEHHKSWPTSKKSPIQRFSACKKKAVHDCTTTVDTTSTTGPKHPQQDTTCASESSLYKSPSFFGGLIDQLLLRKG